jgi:hypothetical protein
MKSAISIFIFSLQFLGTSLALSHVNNPSENIKKAVAKLSACGNFIRFDTENVYTGFGNYWTSHRVPREPKSSILSYIPLHGELDQNEQQIVTSDSVIDVLKIKEITYVLTYSGLELWDLKQKQRLAFYKTHELNSPLDDEEHPRAFARYKDKLIIAHGRLGLVIFDLKTHRAVKTLQVASNQGPLESVVNGVTVSGSHAFAVVDSYSVVGPNEKPAFQGLVILDLESERIVSELNGLPPGVDGIVSDEKMVIVSFYGIPLWKFSKQSLFNSKLPSPLRKVWKFPIEGHPIGKASMDSQHYYSCFLKAPLQGEGPLFKKISIALDRRALILD